MGVLHALVEVRMLCHLVSRGIITVNGDRVDTRGLRHLRVGYPLDWYKLIEKVGVRDNIRGHCTHTVILNLTTG